MLTLIAALVFSAAALLAIGTIGWMFLTYRDKMVAALTFDAIPETTPVYQMRIRRPRVFSDLSAMASVQPGRALAA